MAQMNRREFLTATGIAAFAVLSLPVLQSTAHAAAPAMPDKPLDVGELKSFDKDAVAETFAKRPNYIYLVRKDNKLFACQSVCSHKWRPMVVQNNEFYCPAHKGEFTFEGKPTAGPPKTSLPRYKIGVDDKGHVIVDFAKQFDDTTWDDAESFVVIKSE